LILRRTPAAALLLGLLACASPFVDSDRPRFRVGTERGDAFAHHPGGAERLAEEWRSAAAHIEDALPDVRRVPPIEIWLQRPDEIPDPFGLGQPMGGVTFLVGGRPVKIHVPDSDEFLWVLGHELTHAAVDVSPAWGALPGVLEEGLCEQMGSRLDPASLPRRWLSVMFEAPPLLGVRGAGLYFPFRVRREGGRSGYYLGVFEGGDRRDGWSSEELTERLEAASLDAWPEERSALERLGFFLVSRIVERQGIDGLRALCDEAARDGHRTVRAARTLQAAGVDDWSGLRDALEAASTEDELRAWLEREPAALARWFVGDLRRVIAAYSGTAEMWPEQGYLRASDRRRRYIGRDRPVVQEMRALLDAGTDRP